MTSDSAASARMLFKRFLAERWFGGPDFDSWVRQQGELEGELRVLRDQWLSELQDPENSTLLPPEMGARRALSFEPGELIGGFRLLERLGAGAAGEVWKAEELALGRRQVALKLLRPDLVLDTRALERFRREALSGAQVEHPGVVTVYSIGRWQGQPYIAQELVEGGLNLAGWLKRAREQGEPETAHFEQAADLVAQAAEALAAVHARGILHRDIKPQNLLITIGERVKVADFGLAHLAGQDELSRTGDVMGTFAYMSPSQVRGEVKQLDGRADVFSLGATLYELLTFRRAFPGSSVHEVAQRILFEDPPPARSVQPRVPLDLERIAAKALEKRPADRYTSMAAFAGDLRSFLAGEPVLARGTTLGGRVRKWTRRHPTASASAAILLLALLGLGWLNAARASERVRGQIEALHARALYAIEMSDLDGAGELIAEADRLVSDDPTGQLILALGFAREGRVPELEQALEQARARGFEPESARIEGGLGHAAQALYSMTRRDLALYPEVERHIDLALAADPKLYVLEFPRYLMRAALGDRAGARAALEAFRRHIPQGEPLSRVLEALELELAGEDRAALEELEGLRSAPGMSEERLTQLRWHRVAGRLCVTLGEFERAQALLERAVADTPDDCNSLDNLGVLFLKKLQAGDESQATRAAAREHALRTQACNASLANPALILAYLAVDELNHQTRLRDIRTSPAWQEARAALDRLAASPGGLSDQARTLESHLTFLEGSVPYGAGRYGEASPRFERALELDPSNALAAALLGQCYWHLDRPLEGLSVLDRGLALWDDPTWTTHRKSDWLLGALVVWRIGSAARSGRGEDYVRAVERFTRELRRGTAFKVEELLTAAEFLATAPESLRDCELAWKLVDQHDLARAFKGTPVEGQAEATLQRIETACP